MKTAAQKQEGTTLYISELSSGLVCTLSIRDVGTGSHEKNVWNTSYPLLNHMYPHWVKKQPVNTPIDFVWESLKKAEDGFGWKMLSGSKSFRMPEERFGEGLSKIVLMQERGTAGILDRFKDNPLVSFYKKEDLSLGERLLPHLDSFVTPVIFIVVNFFSVEIVECMPKHIGNYKRWEYKTSKVVFDTPDKFVDFISLKRFLPFVGEHVSENHIFNTVLNYVYWRPIKTSSKFAKDLWRAITTSILNELVGHTNIHKYNEGHVIVTGEVPLFMDNDPMMQLAVVDGLGLSGVWSITVDSNAQAQPMLIDAQYVLFNDIMGDNTSMWIIPQLKKNKSIVSVSSKDNEYKGIYGSIYTYGIQQRLHNIKYKVNNSNIAVKDNPIVDVKRLVLDLRPWPVVYGPNTLANSERIPRWISRINNELRAE